MKERTCVFVLIFAHIVITIVEGANILAIHPYPGPSQYIVVQPFLKALAARGHNLTVINAFPQKEALENYNDLPVMEVHQMMEAVMMELALTKQSKWANLNMLTEFSAFITNAVLNNSQVQDLLFKKKPKIDLIIVEALQIDAVYGFAQHFNAPLIGISTFGADSTIDDLMGNLSPMSYVPTVTSGFTDQMSYWERLQNVIDNAIESLFTHCVQLPKYELLYKHYFPNATADFKEMRRNFSLMLLNQHFSLSFPRPYVPNMIEVAGWHINYKPSPLPIEMAKFLDESKDGVIYFSLGSNLQSKDLPKEKLDMIMRVFAKLPQRVMWKFEDPNLPGKPKNVFIAKWFPQPDILAHPNVKLFITHGGLISSIESVYHGKPIVGIPFFYDQFLNVQRAKSNGYGDGLDIKSMTEHDFNTVIKRVLEDPRYTKIAQQMSTRFRDQPQDPLEKAIYWTEYVLRHKGAPHMHVAGKKLNFVQLYSVDTIGILIVGFIFLLIVLVCLVKKLFKLFFRSGHTKFKSE